MATITWNALNDSSWSGGSNWTPTSVPTSADDVIFNGTSVKDCTVNVDASFNSINITSAYTGFLKATSQSFTSTQNFLDVGTGRRDYGRSIRVINNLSRLNLGPTSSDITASNCALQFDGTGIKVDWSVGNTFKSLTLSNNAAIILNGSQRPKFTDTTCPLVLGQDSTFDLRTGIDLNLNGGGSYINLPTSYKFTGATGGITFSGTSTNTVLTIPDFTSFSTMGAMNFDNSGADRTYNIYNFRTPGSPVKVRNDSSRAVYNFLSDFSSVSLSLGNTSAGATTSFNFNSGTFNIRGPYSSADYTSSNDGTFNFSDSKWIVQGNWKDGSNYEKNEGISSVTFNYVASPWITISSSGHKFYDVTSNNATVTCSGDLTCHSLRASGSWFSTGVNLVASGYIIFTGNISLGTGVYLTGDKGYMTIGTLSTVVDTSNCDVVFTGRDQNLIGGRAVTFKSLVLYPGADATLSPTNPATISFTSTSSPLVFGLDSTLTVAGDNEVYFNKPNGGTFSSFPTNYVFKCTGVGGTGTLFGLGGNTVMPGFKYSGGVMWFYSIATDTTVNLSGPLDFSSSGIYITSTSGYKMVFNTQNYSITALTLAPGVQDAGGQLTANYGSSIMVVNTYSGASFQQGTTYENFSTSNWTVTNDFRHGLNHVINPGTSVVSSTSIDAATITTLGYSFYDVNLSGAGTKTITGDLVAHNFIQTAGAFSISGTTTLSGLANLTSTGTSTFGSTITFNAPTTEFTINSGGTYNGPTANLNFNGLNSIFHCYNSASFRQLTLATGVNLLLDGSFAGILGFTAMTLNNDATYTYNNVSTGYLSYSASTGSFFTLGTNTLWNGTAPGDKTAGIYLSFSSSTVGVTLPKLNYMGTAPWRLTCPGISSYKFFLNGDLNIGQNRLTIDGFGGIYDTSGYDITCGDIHWGFTTISTFLYFRDSTINCTLYDTTYKSGSNLTLNYGNSLWNVDGNISFGTYTPTMGTSTFNIIGNSNIHTNSKPFYDVTVNAPGSMVTFFNGYPLTGHSCHLADGTLAFSGTTTISEEFKVSAGIGTHLNFNTRDLITKHLTLGGGDPSGVMQVDFGTGSMTINGNVNPIVYEDGTKNLNFYRSNWKAHGNWTFPLNCNTTYGWSKFTFDASNGADSTIISNNHYFNWVTFGDATGRKIVLADDFVCREAKIIDATVVKTGKYTEAWDNFRSNQVLGYAP